MKLIGSSNNGRRVANKSADIKPSAPAPVTSAAQSKTMQKNKRSVKNKIIIVICAIIGASVLLLGITFAVYRWEIQPLYDIMFPRPDESRLAGMRTPRPATSDTADQSGIPVDSKTPEAEMPPLSDMRSMNKITFLILGVDGYKGLRSEGGANTDVVMVASFDMDDLDMEIVSIPRDTIVNVPWSVKKINSIWANMSAEHRGSRNAEQLIMADTKAHFANLLGFEVDFWVMIDMAAFEGLINAMPGGGVRYNVPRRIHLEEPNIGFDVTLNPGEQILNGRQSLALIRYRGYSSGDFGRIEEQQNFLKAAAMQILSNRDSLDPMGLANTLIKYVNTDMDVTTMARIGREMLKLDGENVRFTSAPSTGYGVSGGSYVYIHLDEWLEIVNDKLNPFYEEITPEDVSILTLAENGRFYVTDDNWQGSQNWGR